MSGGSYAYLCRTEPLDLPGKLDQLTAMHARIAALGYAGDAAAATQSVIDVLRSSIETVPHSHEWDYILEEERSRLRELEDDGAIDEANGKINALEGVERLLGNLMSPLRPLWRAIEWWDSMDSSEQGFREALSVWRQPVTTSPDSRVAA